MLIQDLISQYIQDYLGTYLAENNNLNLQNKVEIPQNQNYGDISSTAPLALSKVLKKAPYVLAEEIKKVLDEKLKDFAEIEVIKPGFINFKLKPSAYGEILQHFDNTQSLITQTKNQNDNQKLLIEFVSANPTGDLHLGHGRGAVIGSALANLLKTIGQNIITEFYINDAGEQINKLGLSAWNLYKPDQAFEGADQYPAELIQPYLSDLKPDLKLEELTNIVKERILNKQKEVLKNIRVNFDLWFSEKKELHENNCLEKTLKTLESKNLTYQKDNALWLKSSELGDERDRVLIKSEGKNPTYLAGDIAYHINKFERATNLLDIFGADHQGQELSLKVTLKALGYDESKFQILFIQFVSLLRNGTEVKMSKRNGSVITVEEVLEEVGADAFRFMLLLSNINNKLAFDIDLAKKADDQNPVFYVQYAHARACSILRNACQDLFKEQDLKDIKSEILDLIMTESLSDREKQSTKDLILKLSFFNHEVHRAAETLNPSALAHYLIDIANKFHSFYGSCKVINPDNKNLSLARLSLIKTFQRIMQKGLEVLIIDAPEKM